MTETTSKKEGWHVVFTRDWLMFILGAFAFIYILISGDDRAPLLYAALALMGVGAALKGFQVVRKNGNGS